MYSVIAEPARDFVNWGSKIDTPFSQATPKLFRSKLLSKNFNSKFRLRFPRNHRVGLEDEFISLKCKSCLRIGAPYVLGPKRKLLKFVAFKSSGQKDESGGMVNESKSLKNSVGLSYIQQDSEAALVESPKAQSFPASYPSEADSTTGSLAIQNLFKSWLTQMRRPLANQTVDETLEESSLIKASDTECSIHQKERVGIAKALFCYFMGLNATVKIPLLIFIPWYLAVNFMYGAEVSRDLTPLWVLGPLIAALYVKMFRAVCSFYVFIFKQTAKVVRNLLTYYFVAYKYIVGGELIKKMDNIQVSRRKLKDFWGEKYVDFLELIWPIYFRTRRLLKRANLI